MKRPRIIIAGAGLAALAAAGGITAASASGSTAASAASMATAAATVRTAQVTVAGKTETILVNVRACRCTSTGPTPRRSRWSPAGWPGCGRR